MSVEGLKVVITAFDELIDTIDIREPTYKAISVVQEAAKGNVCVKTGELRGSIYTDVQGSEQHATGTCYTNKAYAIYVEFGTGPNGEKEHAGISPNVAVAYRQTGWMIPASAMSEAEAREYGFGIAKDGDLVIGYYTKGQPARPYLYPAAVDHVDEIANEYEQYVKKKVSEL